MDIPFLNQSNIRPMLWTHSHTAEYPDSYGKCQPLVKKSHGADCVGRNKVRNFKTDLKPCFHI